MATFETVAAHGDSSTGGKRGRRANGQAALIGYEAQLWQMADALRGSMDAAEYKHVVLGLIFLKYISDAFEEQHARLEAEREQGADPEDPDEYRALNTFWVPPEARWSHIKAQAKQSNIGSLVDDAMEGIERDNPSLKGVLPKDYARPGLDKERLGQIIDLITNIRVGDEASKSKDVLGKIYEYFLAQFASAEGKKGGQFYTPSRVVRVLVEMLAPYKGRVYDPCCGSGGMFVSSEKFLEAHSGKMEVIEAGEGYEIMPGCKVIELPGHSPGSIGLEVETEEGTWIITGDAIHAAPIAQAGANPLIFWNQEQASASIRRVTQSGAIILPGHDRPFRMKNGDIEYIGEFSMRINGANPDTPGLAFDAAGPKYMTGNAEGWEKGDQKAWIMPGLEEQAGRLKSGRARIPAS